MKQLVTLVNIAHACSTIIAPQIDTDGLNPLHHQCLLSYIYIVCVQLHTLLIVLERRLELEEKSNKSQNKCISNAFLKYVAIIQDYVHLYNSNRVKIQNLTRRSIRVRDRKCESLKTKKRKNCKMGLESLLSGWRSREFNIICTTIE